MKEETRSPLLKSSDNGELEKKVIHGGWDCENQEDEDGKAPIDASNSSSPLTLMLLVAVFFGVLGSFSFGFSVGYTSPVESEMMTELDLSTSEFTFFGSMVNIGSAISAVMCGKITDYLGRRGALQLADVFFMLGWFATAVCQGPWLLDLGRWTVGFAMTIVGYTCPVYVAEFTPKNLRGAFVVLHLLMVTIGASMVFLIGLVVSWRTLALIGMIPCLVQFIGLFFVPESPRWLMMMGQDEGFKAALQSIRGGANVDVSHEATVMKEDVEALQQMSKVSLLELFQRKYAYVLTVGFGLAALSSLVGLNGVIFYARSTFEAAGFSGTIGTIAIAAFQLPAAILSVILLDSYGRRPLLMISAAGLCLGCSLAGLSFLLQDHQLLQGISPYFALVGVLTYVAAYPLGVGGVSAVIASEIYPINIKGLAGSVSGVISCICGWAVSYAFTFMMDWSSSGTFFVLGSICAFTIVFTAKLVPETKGRTLEEVHKSMTHVWQ